MKKYNLTDLLDGEILVEQDEQSVTYKLEGIEIPIIQRDYAQGRKSVAHIRLRFLNVIFNALSKSEVLELDFVYGSIKSQKKGDLNINVFLPLDGQQRLTTLFLIYWFIANTELEGEELDKVRRKLSRFSYATRTTARTFCEKLSKIGYKKNREIDSKKSPNRGIAVDEITGSYWFYKNYENDPTVVGMLNTLDDIQKEYEKLKTKNIFQNLEKLCFYILPLDGFDLTDELYIKMNARGKPLTDFENFKADLINWMKSEENIEQIGFEEEVSLGTRLVPKYLSIASSFDNKWTDIFWPIAISNEKDEDKIVDGYFLRFINRYFLNKFIVSTEKSSKNIEESTVFQFLYSDRGDGNITYKTFEDYKPLMTLNNIKSLEQVLNKLHKHQSVIRELIKPIWDSTANWFLYDAKINQVQRILFLAVTEYLEKNEFEEETFSDWMRIAWNIIIDPDVRTISNMINAMKLIHQLSIGSENIYQFLIEKEALGIIEQTKFLKSQLEEERLKAQLIFSDSNWKKQIIEAESHSMYMGNIGFLLNEDIAISEFIAKFKIAKSLFNSNGSNNVDFKEHLIMRSILSKMKNWKSLYKFDFADTHFNWQFLLRKKDWIGKIINGFCTYETIVELQGHLEKLVSLESNIESWNDEKEAVLRAKNAHKSIYVNGKFHSWLQDNNAISSKWAGHHYYVHRPRSRKDWVMIDVRRNDIVTHLINDYDFLTDQDCNGTNYYYGFGIELYKNYENYDLKVILDYNGDLKIGFSKAKKDFILEFDVIEEDIENQIFYIKKYDYDNVITDSNVTNFMAIIENEIFSETNNKSVFYKIKNL